MESTETKAPFVIDVEKVMKSRSKILSMMPRFVINYIKRIVHQDEINEKLSRYGHLQGLEFISEVIKDFKVKIKLIGLENLPESGRFIFFANHPLGGFDGMVILNILGEKYIDVKTVSNDLLMNFTNLHPIFIGVNLHGLSSKEAVLRVNESFNSNTQIMIFPAGLVSRRENGVVRDADWKKTFLTRAIKHQRDLIPIHVEGRVSNFFYNLASIRKFFGIKTNFEMFFLSDETFKYENGSLTIRFGKPLSYKIFDKRQSTDQWVNLLKEHVYIIGEKDYNAAFPYTEQSDVAK